MEVDWTELEKGINLQFAKQCFIDHKRSKNEKYLEHITDEWFRRTGLPLCYESYGSVFSAKFILVYNWE